MTVTVAIIQTLIFHCILAYWFIRTNRVNKKVVKGAEKLLEFKEKHLFNLVARVEILEHKDVFESRKNLLSNLAARVETLEIAIKDDNGKKDRK